MIVQANAKINLTLNVIKKQDNGYHKIKSLMIPLNLHDTIEIKLLKDDTESYVTYDSFDLNGDKFNSVTTAIKLFKEKYNIKENFNVTIYKRIFVSAGLGGGSSDAANVLLGIIKLLKLDIKKEDLIDICLKVGSDVSFFLYDKMCLVEGIGEKVIPIDNYSKYYVLLIKPKAGLSTEKVYAKYDEMNLKDKNINYEKILNDYNSGDFEALKNEIYNGLEIPAIELCPDIEKIKNRLINEEKVDLVAMSGSGSCLFVLGKNKRFLYKLLKKYYQNYQIELTKVI